MFEMMNLKAVIFTVTLFFLLGCNQSPNMITPTVHDITESVYASVTIEPDSLYKVYSVVSGILTERHVREGDEVSKGQILMQIRSESPELNAENARLVFQLAQENLSGSGSILKTLQNKIETAYLTYQQDSVDYLRQSRLRKQNIGTQREYELRKMAFERSAETLQSLHKEYSRTKAELNTALNTAKNNYQNAKLGKEDYSVKSSMNGKVYALYKEEGELISPQEPIATVGRSDSFTINLLVDEVDIIKIRINQQVIVSLDAFEDQVFEAKVTRILPQKDSRTQTFTIEAKFIDPPDPLYSGLSGEGNIIIDQKKDVLVIPRSYLMENDQVNTGDGVVQVEVGLMNMDYVEIISGLDSTTHLLLP
jgi:multidrug efflux pump subunit AcrA (membrane-fusion protein)